jgi:hypothetical protein
MWQIIVDASKVFDMSRFCVLRHHIYIYFVLPPTRWLVIHWYLISVYILWLLAYLKRGLDISHRYSFFFSLSLLLLPLLRRLFFIANTTIGFFFSSFLFIFSLHFHLLVHSLFQLSRLINEVVSKRWVGTLVDFVVRRHTHTAYHKCKALKREHTTKEKKRIGKKWNESKWIK